jgi:CheY-like chemotaxis protein
VLSLQRLGPLDALDTFDRPVHGPRPRQIQVLLVDDSVVSREMVRRLLEDGGLGVTSVGSADDALQALEDRDFDCLVTDIEMPGMDGLGLTRKLRRDSRLAELPIVVVSTLDRPADRLAGLESGADAYLTKQGLDARELVALVYRVGGGQ